MRIPCHQAKLQPLVATLVTRQVFRIVTSKCNQMQNRKRGIDCYLEERVLLIGRRYVYAGFVKVNRYCNFSQCKFLE